MIFLDYFPELPGFSPEDEMDNFEVFGIRAGVGGHILMQCIR